MSSFNERCAQRADRTITFYNEDRQDGGIDHRDDVRDLLTDLLHLCRVNDIDFTQCLEAATLHAAAEANDADLNAESEE